MWVTLCSTASPVAEVGLGAVGNSGLVRVALPRRSSFAPHDPLAGVVGTELLLKL